MEKLSDALFSYAGSDYYGFHMPGHKRNKKVTGAPLPYEIDITEIDGFDNLHHAKGILKEAQERAASVYRAEETCFLVNGSTAGILSAVLGCTQRGEKILTARNCHKSVYHAIELNELEPVYLYPRFEEEKGINGPVEVEAVRDALRLNPDIRAVIIVSPTYDGVVSDVRRIAEAAHEYGIPLIVDGAHGAHFGFHPYFPEHANAQGADVVINSVHKTLPALTQTALIHMNGIYADRDEVKKYLHIVQSSSPSYVLMAGIDECICMLEERGGEVFEAYVKLLEKTRARLHELKSLKLVETDDRSKLVISVKGTDCSSQGLYYRLLKEYHLQMEMAAGSYVLAMTSVGDTAEGMDRLVRALLEMDEEITKERTSPENRSSVSENRNSMPEGVSKNRSSMSEGVSENRNCMSGRRFELPHLERVYTSAEMAKKVRRLRTGVRALPWEQCTGFVSTEYAYLYPPGIPLVVPGERISAEAVRMLLEYRRLGFEIEGLKKDGEIEVWADE